MTSLAFQVLRLLSDGEFRSGSELAKALGVTRGTIWNAVRVIEGVGIEIYRVRGRGYRLPNAVLLLEPSTIASYARGSADRYAIEIVDIAESTNTLLMGRAASGAPSGTVLAAEWQTRGRGRMGRPWHAGIGEGVMFSLLWRFASGAGGLAGLSLAVGVALARALEEVGVSDLQLKWPNDVLWKGCKVAGILLEMQGDAVGPSDVVIGIGINTRLSERTRNRIDQAAADLETASGGTLDRNRILGGVLAELAPVLLRFEREGFAPFRPEWQARHAHQDKAVTVTLPDGRACHGYARGVGDDGALLLESGNATRRLHSAEVRLDTGGPAVSKHAGRRALARGRA